ncbi:MAG TPA: TerC family protein [Lachnospiraceae bacterium]|nr:TerC family protein [Lachnospiraceae bacterium]
MSTAFGIIWGVLQITILDLTLSGDNIGVIALVTRRLPEESAKLASLLGIAGALIMRIIFACVLTYVLAVSWLPIRLLGGFLLIKITWDFIKPKQEEAHEMKEAHALKDAIFTIIIADISMSLDNVLALAAAADGRIVLLVIGILLNIPIIFFGSKFVADLMNKFEIVIYVGGALLAHTSIKMIFEDQLFEKYIHLPVVAGSIIPWCVALLVLFYGFHIMNTHKVKAAMP